MSRYASIIICTYNRAHLLERALRSIARQTLKPDQFEVVVVDDGSTDQTLERLEMIKKEMPNLRYLSNAGNIGTGGSANLGVRAARGDYILFIDDDCIARADWAERLISTLDRESIAAGAVHSPTSNPVKLCHNIAQFGPFMSAKKPGPIEFIAGANLGFRRFVFEEINGFQDAKRTDPDMEFILRARFKGHQVHFSPDAVVTHDPDRFTLAEIFKYASDHAFSTIVLRNQYQSLLRTPFILKSPVLILSASPVIALVNAGKYYLHSWFLMKFIWTFPMVYALKMAWCWGAFRGLRKWKNSVKDG